MMVEARWPGRRVYPHTPVRNASVINISTQKHLNCGVLRRKDRAGVGHLNCLGGGRRRPERALRGVCPELEARGSRPAPFLRAARPGLAGAHQSLPAAHEPIHCQRIALPPGGPVGAPDPRVSVRARYYLAGTHTPHALEGPHLNGTETQHLAQPKHAHEDRSPTQPPPGGLPPPPHAPGIITPRSSENPATI
eukprot:scaffold27021_cov66-Phaeocystis_antarctica.AAC.1